MLVYFQIKQTFLAMKSVIEFIFYVVMFILFYRFIYSNNKISNKSNNKIKPSPKSQSNNDVLDLYYDKYWKEYIDNSNLYGKKCKNNTITVIKTADSIYEGESIYGYKHGCGYIKYGDGSSYQGFWESDVDTGFGIFHNKNDIVIAGYKKNKKYHGLVVIFGKLTSLNEKKTIFCIYEDGTQQFCFAKDPIFDFKYIIPNSAVEL